MNAKVFAALKPGGIYVVIDHVANPTRPNAPDTVHRIDPGSSPREIEAAGFRLDGETRRCASARTITPSW